LYRDQRRSLWNLVIGLREKPNEGGNTSIRPATDFGLK
jgi:hypothetical protein